MHRVGREVGLKEQMRSFHDYYWTGRLSNVVIVLALFKSVVVSKPAYTEVHSPVHLRKGTGRAWTFEKMLISVHVDQYLNGISLP